MSGIDLTRISKAELIAVYIIIRDKAERHDFGGGFSVIDCEDEFLRRQVAAHPPIRQYFVAGMLGLRRTKRPRRKFTFRSGTAQVKPMQSKRARYK